MNYLLIITFKTPVCEIIAPFFDSIKYNFSTYRRTRPSNFQTKYFREFLSFYDIHLVWLSIILLEGYNNIGVYIVRQRSAYL